MITDRIDAITRIPPAYRCAAPPAPKSVKIEVSPRCDYRCGFCALRTREAQPKRDMDLQFFKRITQDMRDAGVEEIGVFYLGESFMNPRLLVDCIRHAKQTLGFPYVFLTSNASMAFPEAVEACMDAGLDSLKWSCNAADAAQFTRIMGVAERLFHRATENIAAAWRIRAAGGYRTGLYASSIRYDGEQQGRMEQFLDRAVRPFVDEHYWLPLYSMGAFATEREQQLGYRPIAGNQGRLDATAHWTMGDLRTQSFMSAWQSPAFVQLRKAHLRRDVSGTVCQSCVACG